ncbi:DUF4167 domain-containing protein [Brucellaceae bacterium C25G]
MRPAQQNRRMRGRGNNNNRKGPNPLTRNYESNGPDVKIRGNAQHIAEKYATLARDAQVSGDRVMAENYLQHAEHYNRIILQAQAQNPQHFQRDENFDDENGDEEQSFTAPSAHNGHANAGSQEVNGSGPQPFIEGTPAEVVYDEDNNSNSRQHEHRGQNREHNRDGQSRDHQNRENQGRENQGRDRDQRRIQRPRRPSRFEQHNTPVAPDAPQPMTSFAENAERSDVKPVEAKPADIKPAVEAQEQSQPVVVNVEPVVTAKVAVEEQTEKKAASAKPRTPRAKPAEVAAESEEAAPVRRRGRPRRVKDEDADAAPEVTEA